MTLLSFRAANAAPQLPKRADLLVTTTSRPSGQWHHGRISHRHATVLTGVSLAHLSLVPLHAVIVHTSVYAGSGTGASRLNACPCSTNDAVPVSLLQFPRGLHRPNHPVRPSLHHGIHRRGSATGDAHLPVRRIMPVTPAPCRLTIAGTARDVTGARIGPTGRHVGSVPTIRATATKGECHASAPVIGAPRMSDMTSDASPAQRVRGADRRPDNLASPITPMVAAPTAARIFGIQKGIPVMPQTLRLSTKARAAVEELQDIAMTIHADGIVSADEITRFRHALHTALDLTAHTDDSLNLAMVLMKGGDESGRFREVRRDYEQTHGRVIQLHAKKHRRDSHPDSAA